MRDALFDGPTVFVDVETTGGNPTHQRIIEVGLVAANGGELEYEWSTLVNPGMAIPLSIQHFTGITDEMVRDAPYFEDIVDELASKLEGRLFVAHNARFDYGFFRQEFRRLDRKLTSRVACTVKLSRRLYPELPRHNLDALIEHHGFHCETRHRALGDARVLWQFWQKLRAERDYEEVEDALQEIVGLKSLPAHLPPDLPDQLPEAPGVYRFYGESGALLYVGKAKNIRQRVLNHWQSAVTNAREQKLTELTRRVEWTRTAGELGALLLEARQVRELKPLYNRQLRGHGQVWTWVVADDGAAPELAPLDQLPLSFAQTDIFGLYRTPSAAKKALVAVAREHRLCLKMLGLESSRGSCFAYQLGHCAGACVGEESLPLHTARLKIAMASQRLKSWPYQGAIGIREVSDEGLEQLHIIDDWRHVATIESDDELPDRIRRQPFDIDVYKILTRHMKNSPRLRIVLLAARQDAA